MFAVNSNSISPSNSNGCTPNISDLTQGLNFGLDIVNLQEMCMVHELMESDLDQLLKCKINFQEKHLLRIVYNVLLSLTFLHETNIMHISDTLYS